MYVHACCRPWTGHAARHRCLSARAVRPGAHPAAGRCLAAAASAVCRVARKRQVAIRRVKELPRRSCHPFIPTSLHCGKRTRKHTETGGDTCVRQAEPGRYMLMGDLRSRSPLGRIGESWRGILLRALPVIALWEQGGALRAHHPAQTEVAATPTHTMATYIRHTTYRTCMKPDRNRSIYHSQELDSTTIDRLEARWPMDSKSGARCSLTSKNIE